MGIVFSKPPADVPQISAHDLKNQVTIGVGGASKIYKADHENKPVAIKRYKDGLTPVFHREANLLSQLSHPNIIRLLGYVNDEYYALVLTFAVNGTLDNYLFMHTTNMGLNRDADFLGKVTLKIALGMEFMHAASILHRDLKPSNILFNENREPIIADLSLGEKMIDNKYYARAGYGTPIWSPRECHDSIRLNVEYSRVDEYSFGWIMFVMATDDEYEPPIKNKHYEDKTWIDTQTGTHHCVPKMPQHIPEATKSLISQCWSLDPSKRPGFTKLKEELQKIGIVYKYSYSG